MKFTRKFFSVPPCLCGKKSRGFTIVELLVSMFIALIIFGIGFTILNGAVLARADAQSRIQANDSARQLFEMFERDLADAYPGPWTPPFDKSSLVASGQPGVAGDVVTLTTTGEVTKGGAQEIVSVRYYVLSATGQLYRETETGVPPTPPFAAAPAPNDLALFPNVKSLTAVYSRWDENSKSMIPLLQVDSAIATHLKVTLVVLLPSEKDKKVDPLRLYSKFIPIPGSFEN